MLDALDRFMAGLSKARDMSALFDVLTITVKGPFSFEDLLRSQLVYTISAFDKLIHDLVRIGMVSCYTGTKKTTRKFHSETISIELHNQLATASLPPKEVVFEQEMYKRLKVLSFQDPDKVADGLSYIWEERHKWDCIGREMNRPGVDVRTELRLIVNRRNAIVHESDLDPLSHERMDIDRDAISRSTDFIDQCGNAIYRRVNAGD